MTRMRNLTFMTLWDKLGILVTEYWVTKPTMGICSTVQVANNDNMGLSTNFGHLKGEIV